MQKLKQEINRTIAQMQADICGDAHAELQWHLKELLEMRRNELQSLLVERSRSNAGKGIDSNEKPAIAIVEPYKSMRIIGDEINQPLTIEELKAGWRVVAY